MIPPLSFSGAGFFGSYHVGVMRAAQSLFPIAAFRAAGASAGALVACAMVTGVPSDACKEVVETLLKNRVSVGDRVRGKPGWVFAPGSALMHSLRRHMDEILPEDAHFTCTGRLKVAVTVTTPAPQARLSVTEFPSRDFLLESLLASAYIPVWAGRMHYGSGWIDGGFSDMFPSFGDDTVYASCFSGPDIHICPQMHDRPSLAKHRAVSMGNCHVYANGANLRVGRLGLFPSTDPAFSTHWADLGNENATAFFRQASFVSMPPPVE